MNPNDEYSNIVREAKDVNWLGIHYYDLEQRPDSHLYGDTWKKEIWNSLAEKIYQQLEINIFKLVLFKGIFKKEDFPIVVSYKIVNHRDLTFSVCKNNNHTEINFEFYDKNNDEASLKRIWENIENSKNDFTASIGNIFKSLGIEDNRLIESYSNELNIDKIKTIINEFVDDENYGNNISVKAISSYKINLNSNELKSLFCGALLWPWNTLLYESLKAINNQIRAGIVVNLEKGTDVNKFIASPAFYKIYINCLSRNWETEQEERNKHAVKSAIAAIMSRNGSHNIGSHVLSASNYNIIDPSDAQTLMLYIQQRWDFLAQATSEWPKWTASLKFISQIMRGFYEQRILLNNIVHSEGLKAQEDFQTNDFTNTLRISLHKKTGSKTRKSEFEDDFGVAIPGGVSGIHAFYTILENIIRNSAKHGYRVEADTLMEGMEIIIQYEIKEDEKKVDFFIYDKISDQSIVNENIKESSDEKSNKNKSLQKQINKPLLDPNTGILDPEGWGIAEIKIATGYLNKKTVDEIGRENIDFLDACPRDAKKGVGYLFSIPLPKEILIIGDTDDKLRNKYKDDLGIEIKKNKPEICDYEFVINNLDNKEPSKIPARYFHSEDVKNEKYPTFSLNEASDSKELKSLLYKKWLTHLYNKCISDEIKGKWDKKVIYVHIDTSGGVSGSGALKDDQIWNFFIEKFKDSYSQVAQLDTNDEDDKILKYFITHSKEDLSEFPWTVFKNSVGPNFKEIEEKLKLSKNTVRKVFSKYEEDIETLPPMYKLSKSKDSGSSKWSDIIGNQIKIGDFSIEIVGYDVVKDNPAQSIVFKRHFNPNINFLYAEALSGAQSYFNMIHWPQQNWDSGIKLFYELVETALLNILVVDERFEEYYRNISPQVRTRLDRGKISSLSISDFSNENKKSQNKGKFRENQIVIIHLGVLQKHGGKELIGTIYEDYNVPYVFITSGKGKVPEEYNGEKFIPYADVQRTLMNPYPEKLLLVKTLMKIT